MQWHAVPQKTDAQLLHLIEVRFPVLVMAAPFHLIDANAPVLNGGAAVFDPRREHECRHHAAQSHRANPSQRGGIPPRLLLLRLLEAKSRTGRPAPWQKSPGCIRTSYNRQASAQL